MKAVRRDAETKKAFVSTETPKTCMESNGMLQNRHRDSITGQNEAETITESPGNRQ